MILLLFKIILKTDRQLRCQQEDTNLMSDCDWFSLQCLRPLLHFPSFGVSHGALDVSADQIRLVEQEHTTRSICLLPLNEPIRGSLP